MEFDLIIKKLKNELSPSEEVTFNNWYNASSKHRDYYSKIKISYLTEREPIGIDEAWKQLNWRINKNQKRHYWKVAIAASIIGFIAFSGLFSSKSPKSNFPNSLTSAPIENVSDEAILTLGNGTSIVLTNNTYQNGNIKSNGTELVYEAVNVQEPKQTIEYNYLTVPKGRDFFVTLSDGTKVWLNSDSKLKYPVHFTGSSREVELLYGEAYFEVSPSNLHKGANFIVATQHQVVEVLGTEFNIKAYKEDDFIATTLVGGEVVLTNNVTLQQEYLTPNHQIKLNTQTNILSINPVDLKFIIGWKSGLFEFNDTSLGEIMLVLSRRYDFEVVFNSTELRSKKFSGIFRRGQTIENILESIEKTREATFEIKGKEIIIKSINNE